jgi:hypothetical protein
MSAAPSLNAHVELIGLYMRRPWKLNRLREESSYSAELIDGEGRCIYFRTDGKMLRISGSFPRDRTSPQSNADYLTIGISRTRSPKDAAADIMRRLILHYLTAYDRAAQRYRQEQDKEERLQLMAQALARVGGGSICPRTSRSAKTVYFEHGNAQLWGSGDVSLEFRRLTIEQAIQIAALLQATKTPAGQGEA